MKSQLEALFSDACTALGYPAVPFEVSRPENPQHGEYSVNVGFLLGKAAKKNPVAIAQEIVEYLKKQKMQFVSGEQDHNISNIGVSISNKKAYLDILQDISKLEVAGPGFINIHLTASVLITHTSQLLEQKQIVGTVKKKIVVEFAHPNTHKAFHIGHLRNITTGESLVRLLERIGNTVIRANYQGDVGMHIAKCLYGMLQTKDESRKTKDNPLHERIEYLGKAYAAGSQAYEADDTVKAKVGEINKQIYAKDPAIYPLYQETRQWSLEYFDSIYKRVGSHFDRLYFESEVYETGKKNVELGLEKGIFEKSDGAVIFPGEKFGLHNRVFITSEGNPTYEGKEMGLGPLQFAEHYPDQIIHVVGPEQASYFQVCFEALAQLFPETRGKEFHQPYGWVKLKHGKMSSRTGNVVLGEWLLEEIKTSIYKILEQSISKYTQEEKDQIAEVCAIAAVKYSFLKVGLTQEIAFDIEESINIHGDSGPYLLYTYARCKSVMRRVMGDKLLVVSVSDDSPLTTHNSQLNQEEHHLARHLGYYPEIVAEAGEGLSPSDIARYLTELAQLFNLFYAKHQILESPLRLSLTSVTAAVLKDGLSLLGIDTVERM